MMLANYVEKRIYVADNFREFPSTKRLSSDLSFVSEEGKRIAAKLDGIADKRFEKYANDASDARDKSIFAPADKARYQAIVAKCSENGKQAGETVVLMSTAGVSYVGGLVLGVGGKLFVGDYPVIAASTLLAVELARNDHPALQLAQGGLAVMNFSAMPPEIQAPLLAAQAVARAGVYLCMQLEWPTQLGGNVGEFIGHFLGDWAAWWITNPIQDLTPWKITVCRDERVALTGDIALLSGEIETFKQSIQTDDPQKGQKEKDLETLNTIKNTLSNRIDFIGKLVTSLEGSTK